jgi:hypothetical protein
MQFTTTTLMALLAAAGAVSAAPAPAPLVNQPCLTPGLWMCGWSGEMLQCNWEHRMVVTSQCGAGTRCVMAGKNNPSCQ